MLTEMGAVMIKTKVGLDNIVTITNNEKNNENMENISIIEYSKDDKKEEKKSNIKIITSMINPEEWFEDITKRAKILREKYFKGKEDKK